jgi:hypothetical protein
VKLIILLAATTAAATAFARAAPKKKDPPPRAWLGTFVPKESQPPCGDCQKLAPTARAGAIVVLAPGDGGPAADGDVVAVSPLLGSIARGTIVGGRVAVPWFVFDRRDGATGVLVLPGATKIAFVTPNKADVAMIAQKVQKDELENVRKAVSGLEVAAIDIDGDGVADFAVTYGCTQWADGGCQSHGQFFLARRGGRWVEIE